jgi:hypothetical protein
MDSPNLLIKPSIDKILEVESVYNGVFVNETLANENLVNEPSTTEPMITEPTITEPTVTTLSISEPSMNEAHPSDSNTSPSHMAIAGASAEESDYEFIWGDVPYIPDEDLKKLAMEHAPQGAEKAIMVGDKEGMNNRVILVQYEPNKKKALHSYPCIWMGRHVVRYGSGPPHAFNSHYGIPKSANIDTGSRDLSLGY